MKKILTSLLLFSCFTVKSQICNSLHLGLFTGGNIRSISATIPPLYREINYYTISIYPKIGYCFSKKIIAGGIGEYTFHKNSFSTLKPTLGLGYFLKYRFLPENDTLVKHKKIVSFIEYQHIVSGGYYATKPDATVEKIIKKLHSLTLQMGIDLIIKKQFSIGLSVGLGAFNFYKNDFSPEEGEKITLRPSGRLTFQYNLNFSCK